MFSLLLLVACKNLVSAQKYVIINSDCLAKSGNDTLKLFSGEVLPLLSEGKVMLGKDTFSIPKSYTSLPDTTLKSIAFSRDLQKEIQKQLVQKSGEDSILIDIRGLLKSDSNIIAKLYGYADTLLFNKKQPTATLVGANFERYFRMALTGMHPYIFDRNDFFVGDFIETQIVIQHLKDSLQASMNSLKASEANHEAEKLKMKFGAMLAGLFGFLVGTLGFWYFSRRNIAKITAELNKEKQKREDTEIKLTASLKTRGDKIDIDSIERPLLAKLAAEEKKVRDRDVDIIQMKAFLETEKENANNRDNENTRLKGQIAEKEAQVYYKFKGWRGFVEPFSEAQININSALNVILAFNDNGKLLPAKERRLLQLALQKYDNTERRMAQSFGKWAAIIDLLEKGEGTIVEKSALQNVKLDEENGTNTLRRMYLSEVFHNKVSNIFILLEEVRILPQLVDSPSDGFRQFCEVKTGQSIDDLQKELAKSLGITLSYVRLFQKTEEDPQILGNKIEKEMADTSYLNERIKPVPPRSVLEIIKYGIQTKEFNADQRRTDVIIKSAQITLGQDGET